MLTVPTHVLLLTGRPGVGKTTVVRRVAEALAGRRLAGFLTDELREAGARVGFALRTVDGESTVLAHVRLRSAFRVGRYGVDVAALDRIAETRLAPDAAVDVYLVDEIGRMECLSAPFVRAMEALFDSTHLVVATVALQGSGLIARAKARRDAEVWVVSPSTRAELPAQVLAWLAARGLGPQPASSVK